jgi:ATP-binding protein involved in chromosome partitioning
MEENASAKKGILPPARPRAVLPVVSCTEKEKKEDAMSLFKKREHRPEATVDGVLSALSHVMDPELGRDLVSLSMIRNVNVSGGDVSLDLVLTTPACPRKSEMKEAVEKAVLTVPGVSSVDVRVGADVQAAKDPMEGRRPVEGVKNILAVASGKGGVGKSTVSANVAMILPATTDGIKVLSIGFMLEEDSPVIWRGPMLMQALSQFLHGTKWGELDYLVIDLPPGTGDVPLSLVQMTPVAGAIVVTTPQDLALIDVKKAVRMFEKVGVPILGVIENMSFFLCPHCHGRSEIFGHGGAAETCRQMGLPFLGEVPLQATLREASDAGVPIVTKAPDSPAAVALAKAASGAAAALTECWGGS